MRRGFILDPTYRIEAGRPVVLLYGKLESNESFLVRDTRQVPCFYVRAADAARAQQLGAELDPTDRRLTLRGESVVRVDVRLPRDVPPLRDRLAGAGIASFEADLRFAYRYLIDRGIRGSLAIHGPDRRGDGVDRVFDDPEIAPVAWSAPLSVASLDIETDPAGRRLLSIAIVSREASHVLLLTPPGFSCPPDAFPCATERDLLAALVTHLAELDPDVITGWNVIDFDLMVLLRVAQRVGLPLRLGRGPEPLQLRPAATRRGSGRALVPGRLVLDGIDLLRGAFVKLDSYALDAAARAILGRGKTLTGPDRADEILQAFESDRPRLVAYNRNDALLVLDILSELRLLELAVERSRLTGMPPDRVAASIASFDFLYLTELHRRGIVAPSVGAEIPADDTPTSGGHVLEPRPGLYRNVLLLDFKSLYPSIIRTFQIDPLGYVPEPAADADLIRAPSGAAFRREPGILPGLLDDLFPRREAARAAGDAVASQAIKILMNSFYGVLGTPACRFADPALANAITSFGREILLWAKGRLEESGHEVLYGDTDSLFVRIGIDDPAAATEAGQRLVTELNTALAAHVALTWRVASRLELQFERLYLRLLLPAMRGGVGGARKRYAGLVQQGDGTRVVFTGMEVVRRDWTELAKRVQRELYERLFSDRPVDAFLRETVAELRAGHHDARLIYRKALRKELSAYTASTPPHVAAARKLHGAPGRIIDYVVTVNGPEPAASRGSPIDHEHYVQKQLRAVAEPVLGLLGLDFDRIIGDVKQLELF